MLDVRYMITNENWVFRLNDSARIPHIDENNQYQEYLLWLSQGNVPLEFDPAVVL